MSAMLVLPTVEIKMHMLGVISNNIIPIPNLIKILAKDGQTDKHHKSYRMFISLKWYKQQ